LDQFQVELDENKKDLLIFWYHITAGYPPNISLITDKEKTSLRFIEYFVCLNPQNEKFIVYNSRGIPYLYKMFLLCCNHSTQFLKLMINHHNFDWALSAMFYTPHYPEMSEELGHLYALCAEKNLDFRKKHLKLTLEKEPEELVSIKAWMILLKDDNTIISFLQMGGFTRLTSMLLPQAGKFDATYFVHAGLSLFTNILEKIVNFLRNNEEKRETLLKALHDNWRNSNDLITFLFTLMNTDTKQEVRDQAYSCLRKFFNPAFTEEISTIFQALMTEHSLWKTSQNHLSINDLKRLFYGICTTFPHPNLNDIMLSNTDSGIYEMPYAPKIHVFPPLIAEMAPQTLQGLTKVFYAPYFSMVFDFIALTASIPQYFPQALQLCCLITSETVWLELGALETAWKALLEANNLKNLDDIANPENKERVEIFRNENLLRDLFLTVLSPVTQSGLFVGVRCLQTESLREIFSLLIPLAKIDENQLRSILTSQLKDYQNDAQSFLEKASQFPIEQNTMQITEFHQLAHRVNMALQVLITLAKTQIFKKEEKEEAIKIGEILLQPDNQALLERPASTQIESLKFTLNQIPTIQTTLQCVSQLNQALLS